MKPSVREEATSYGDSADGLKLMTSSVTSSSRKIQQVACFPRRKRKRRRRGDPVASYSAISRCYLKMAKRCRLHKLIRQRFALAIKIQLEDFALLFQQTKLQWIQSQRKDIQSQCFEHPVARRIRRSFWTTRRKQQQHPVESSYEPAVAMNTVASSLHQVAKIQTQEKQM
ncbi:hypothetical protein F511_28989 [Dorcoceras hygrometricum]|uniref:Uncharacterized protein n=1 Tax=Dorcoceras hygrometricum TaxID=472368 RepID=A0A2Z7ADK7_9LAMI|nr:hypothetical protein F511_28989 [Dorcoceras hygrometricum]